MTFWKRLTDYIKDIANISDHVDTEAASRSIRSNIFFRGANVWILAFSIVIASVGLNVNSTAVIIGAMLISPLMGPIIGIGFGLGINDTTLLKDGFRNLLVMVAISLLASFIYFLVSPLNLANPTELESRTNPTIYDVIIALFGGLAGILEQCRKEKGTVLSGVAIATALMPPLCTAGYGLAKGNMHFFLGALGLFLINAIFIIFATYVVVKYLDFKDAVFKDPATAKRTKNIITLIIIAVMIPSIWSAVVMIRNNNFAMNVQSFVAKNKTLGNAYIYDYKISVHKGRKVEIYLTGESLSTKEQAALVSSASDFGILENQLVIKENSIGEDDAYSSEKIVKGIYDRADSEISKRDAQIRMLEQQVRDLKGSEPQYVQITKEIISQYPEIKDLYISKGAEVGADSLDAKRCLLVVAKTDRTLSKDKTDKLENWLRLRLNDTTVTVLVRK